MFLKNHVLLLKSESPEGAKDEYKDLLEGNGFQVMQIKTLDFQYKNLDQLKEKLLKPEEFSGLILSSPRCVNAVCQALKRGDIERLWKDKFNFVVGASTYRDAADKLGLQCDGKGTGNANNLSQYILKDKEKYHLPFLFPHGNLKTGTLETQLGKENVSIESILAYETIANPQFEEEFSRVTEEFTNTPEIIVFFSPSGIRASIPCICLLPTIILEQIKYIAIGPVTEAAMRQASLRIFSVAKNPTAQDVLEAIISR